MSALPGSHGLRVRIARVLATILAEHSQTHIADVIGVAPTTVARRGDDIHQWPADDLLTLATQWPDLGIAIAKYFYGDESPDPQPVAAIRELFASLALSGQWTTAASAALADGRISQDEAQGLLGILDQRLALAQSLRRDLAAIAEAGK